MDRNKCTKIITTNNIILFILFVAIMGDYLITYIGINNMGFIEELNPLMIRLFRFPMYMGLIIRSMLALFPIILLKFVENRCPPRLKYDYIIRAALGIQAIPFSMHILWIYKYYTSISI